MRLVSIIPAAAAIITFIVTEDLSSKMQLVDKFTALMIIILAVQVIVAALAKVKKEDADETAEEA